MLDCWCVCVLVRGHTEVIPSHSWLDIVCLVLCACEFVGAWVVGMWVCWSVCVLVGGYIEVIPSYSVLVFVY